MRWLAGAPPHRNNFFYFFQKIFTSKGSTPSPLFKSGLTISRTSHDSSKSTKRRQIRKTKKMKGNLTLPSILLISLFHDLVYSFDSDLSMLLVPVQLQLRFESAFSSHWIHVLCFFFSFYFEAGTNLLLFLLYAHVSAPIPSCFF